MGKRYFAKMKKGGAYALLVFFLFFSLLPLSAGPDKDIVVNPNLDTEKKDDIPASGPDETEEDVITAAEDIPASALVPVRDAWIAARAEQKAGEEESAETEDASIGVSAGPEAETEDSGNITSDDLFDEDFVPTDESEDDFWEDEDDLWGDDIWGDDIWAEGDDWFNESNQDIVTGDDAWNGLLEGDDADFWSDFYIAGQEQEIVLPDGSYYMDLYLNDRFSGNVEIITENGEYSIDADTFRYIVSDMASSDEKIFLDTFVGSIPLSALDSRGYVTTVDNIAYTVDMSMPTSALDTVVLSLANGIYGSNMFASRPLGNAIEVSNTAFSLESSYSLSMYVPLYPNFDWKSLLSFDLGVSNRVRILDVYNQFSWGIGLDRGSFNYRFGLYSFYTDFPGHGLRLSWGNVSGYGRPAKGTPLGIKLEKNASYYDETWKRQSYITQELVLEEKSDIIILNGSNVMWSGTLEKGTYLLEDFTLLAGSNDIRMEIRPSGQPEAEPVIRDFNVLYGYSLLAPGENYWGLSFSGGREQKSVKTNNNFTLSVPYLDGDWLEYDVRNFSFGFYFDIGVFRGLTLRSRGSITNNPSNENNWVPSGRIDMSFMGTNSLGSSNLSVSYEIRSAELNNPGEPLKITYSHLINTGFSQSISTGWKWMSSLNLSFNYNCKINKDTMLEAKQEGSYSVSTGGRIGFLNWATALSGHLDFNEIDKSTFALSQSFSVAAGRHANINASLSYSDGFTMPSTVSLRLGVSVYVGGASMSASADDRGNIDYRVSGGTGAHSGSASFNTNWRNGFNTALSGFYSYFGRYFNFGTGLNMTAGFMEDGAFAPSFRNAGLSLNFSTATLFADGLFQIRSSIPYNYLMVKQKGALKGNMLTTASGNSSSESGVFKQFGVATIDGVSGYRDQYLTLYSQSPDGQNYYSYNIKIPRSRRNGYVLILEENFRYTVSGQVEGWYNSSSPLYMVEEVVDEETGETSIELLGTDEYIFSDETTRFLTSPLLPGLYAFDVPLENGAFRLMMFRVDDRGDEGGVVLMEDVYDVASLEINPVYTEFKLYENTRVVTMDEFWEILYPEGDDYYFNDFDFGEEGYQTDYDQSYDELWSVEYEDDLWADIDEDGNFIEEEGLSSEDAPTASESPSEPLLEQTVPGSGRESVNGGAAGK